MKLVGVRPLSKVKFDSYPKYLQDKKIEFVAPYMPTIIVGSFIRLVNKKMEIDGIYQVSKIESKFSNHSEDCETKITVKY